MKLNLLRRYQDGHLLFLYHDTEILVDYLGLHFLKEQGKETSSILDFFSGEDGLLIDHYLLLRNSHVGFRLYDLDNREKVSDYELTGDDMCSEKGYCYDKEKNQLCILTPSNQNVGFLSSFFQEEEDQPTSLLILSFPELKEIKKEGLKEPFHEICYVPFLRKTLLLSDKDKPYFYSGKKEELPQVHSPIRHILINDRTREIYLFSDIGFRVYDSHMVETNKFDLVSDEKAQYPRIIKIMSGDDTMPMDEENMEQKDSILTAFMVNPRLMLVLLNREVGRKNELFLLNVTHGKKEASLVLSYPIQEVGYVKENQFYFKTHGYLHVMEVTDDRD